MRTNIILNIFDKSKDNAEFIIPIKDDETEMEYKDRIYTIANDLFMQSVTELGLDTLDDEDNAPYDDIREETILDIMSILTTGYLPY